MAITVSKPIDEDVWGKTLVKLFNITLDSSYPTNGYTAALGFNPHAFGLKSILGLQQVGAAAAASIGVQVEFDYLNLKLLAYRSTMPSHTHVLHFQTSAAANAVTAAANQLRTAAAAFDVAGVPDSTAEGGIVNAAATQTGLVEVANGINLSTVIVRCYIFGR